MKYKVFKLIISTFLFILFISNYCDANSEDYKTHLDNHHLLSLQRREQFKDARAHYLTSITSHHRVLEDVQKSLGEHQPDDIWVIYDIDDCITFPDHPACLPHSYAREHKNKFAQMISKLDPIQQCIVWNLKYRMVSSGLTEASIPEILTEIKNLGVMTMGLTASLAGGVLSASDCQHKARHDVLKNLGVTFNAPQTEFVLDDFPKFHRSHPVYYNGIGFTQTSGEYGSTTKGEFLIELMSRWSKKPTVVFFIDDSFSNLHRVYKIMYDNNITCFCYHYHATHIDKDTNISERDYTDFIQSLISFSIFSTHYSIPLERRL